MLLLTLASLLLPTLASPAPGEQHTITNYHARNLATIRAIYAQTVYPNSVKFGANGTTSVPPGLFNANASGRIAPVGTFTGFEDSTEYFFGLSPTGQAPGYEIIESADIVHFTSGCPEVAASVVQLRQVVRHPGAPDDGKYLSTMKEVGQLSPCREHY